METLLAESNVSQPVRGLHDLAISRNLVEDLQINIVKPWLNRKEYQERLYLIRKILSEGFDFEFTKEFAIDRIPEETPSIKSNWIKPESRTNGRGRWHTSTILDFVGLWRRSGSFLRWQAVGNDWHSAPSHVTSLGSSSDAVETLKHLTGFSSISLELQEKVICKSSFVCRRRGQKQRKRERERNLL